MPGIRIQGVPQVSTPLHRPHGSVMLGPASGGSAPQAQQPMPPMINGRPLQAAGPSTPSGGGGGGGPYLNPGPVPVYVPPPQFGLAQYEIEPGPGRGGGINVNPLPGPTSGGGGAGGAGGSGGGNAPSPTLNLALIQGTPLRGNFAFRFDFLELLRKFIQHKTEEAVEELTFALAHVNTQQKLPPEDRKGPFKKLTDAALAAREARIERKLALVQNKDGSPNFATGYNVAILVSLAKAGASGERAKEVDEVLANFNNCMTTPSKFFMQLSGWAGESPAAADYGDALAEARQYLNAAGWNKSGG